MSTVEFDRMIRDANERKLRELASDLAERVRLGELSELEANELLAAKQDTWSDSPYG
jgi:hypothetical protein